MDMNSLFWSRLHGGATHFPIALIFAAAVFDTLGFFLRGGQNLHREFRAVAYWLALLGALSSFGAVFSGLALSHWNIGGSGALWHHHLFVWPAFALLLGLGTWRALVRPDISGRAFTLYLIVMLTGCVFIAAAGYFGGEMLLGS
jgi:uncharacterized membrane protein